MKKVYRSLEELMSSRCNGKLKSKVSSILATNRYIQWSFVSASADGDVYRSEFSSPTERPDLIQCLSLESSPRGDYGHIELKPNLI